MAGSQRHVDLTGCLERIFLASLFALVSSLWPFVPTLQAATLDVFYASGVARECETDDICSDRRIFGRLAYMDQHPLADDVLGLDDLYSFVLYMGAAGDIVEHDAPFQPGPWEVSRTLIIPSPYVVAGLLIEEIGSNVVVSLGADDYMGVPPNPVDTPNTWQIFGTIFVWDSNHGERMTGPIAFTPFPVPEPATIHLIAFGLIGLLAAAHALNRRKERTTG